MSVCTLPRDAELRNLFECLADYPLQPFLEEVTQQSGMPALFEEHLLDAFIAGVSCAYSDEAWKSISQHIGNQSEQASALGYSNRSSISHARKASKIHINRYVMAHFLLGNKLRTPPVVLAACYGYARATTYTRMIMENESQTSTLNLSPQDFVYTVAMMVSKDLVIALNESNFEEAYKVANTIINNFCLEELPPKTNSLLLLQELRSRWLKYTAVVLHIMPEYLPHSSDMSEVGGYDV